MSDSNFSIDNIPTYVALPIEAIEANPQKPEQFRVIKNAIIKRLLDGSLCIVDSNEGIETSQLITYLPTIEEPQNVSLSSEKSQITFRSDGPKDEPPPQKPTTLYKCPKCKEVFEKIALYRKHMMWHRNVKKFKCDQCSAGYNVETNLKIHMAMHAEGKPTCPICSISFQRLASLKSHLMLHQVEELYTCEDCGAEFDKEEELNKHLQNHLNNVVQESNGLVCSYCNVQFEDRKSYKEHITHHIKVKKMVLSGKKSRRTSGNKNNPHVCSVCQKGFSKLSLLERHLRVHSGERPFICEHCNKGFNQKGTLQIHLSKHTGIKPFHCTLCSAKFNQKGNLRVHVEKTHTAPMPGVKMYKCPHCTCIFKKIASLNVHIAKCHASSEEVVADITNVMSRLKELEQHQEVAEGTNTSYVKLAESLLDGTVRRYLVMQKKVNDAKWYICTYCSKEFKKPSDLIRHTRVHTREKPFQCEQCGASFALKSTLFYHDKTHASATSNFCPKCKKKFSSMRSLNMHLRKHTEKQHKCLHCNKWFTSLQKARLHDKQAHGEADVHLKQPLLDTPDGLLPMTQKTATPKQHQCSLCKAKFSKVTNLRRHMLLHSGERKYKCEQCFKSYFTAHALKEHSLYHSGVRNFGCKVCGKRFTTSSLLKRHSLSHNTTKPYVCPYCTKSFKSEMLCRKHMNIHKKEIARAEEVVPTVSDVLLTDNTQGIEINNFQLVTQDNDKLPEPSIIDQQLYEVTPNSIQIITNSDKNLTPDSNQIQTIFINCDDLQLSDNLYSQNSDAMLFNSLPDLQDNTTFNIDPITNNFIYNNEILSDQDKSKLGKKETDAALTGSIPYYSQSELNLLLSLGPEFESNNCDNLNLPDINLNEVPVLSVDEAPKECEKEAKKLLSCGKCNKLFTNKKTLAKHVQSHKEGKTTGGNIHPCSFCEKTFKKNSDLVRHIRTHTGEKPFACDKCEKRFSLKSTLLSHQRTHSPVIHKQFNCTVCNCFFSSKSSLKVHTTVHTGDKTHKCNFCTMKFRTAAHRKSHENNYHINPSKKRTKNKVTNLLASVAMDVLNQDQPETPQVVNELENILVVQEQLPFAGDQLLLNEANPTDSLIFQQLQPNILLQDNLLPSSLILNDGTFINVKAIGEEVEKPRNFECEICGKRYASKDVLRKHRKTHGTDKKFRCKKCEKGFDDEESLGVHEKTHDGFRPYSCLYCANSFAKEQSLATHVKRMHGISFKDLLSYDIT